MIIDLNLFLTRYIFKCTGTTIKINGKVNAITLDNCKKVLVLEKWRWIATSCYFICCSHSTFVTWVYLFWVQPILQVAVVFDTVVSSCDFINCQSVQMQVERNLSVMNIETSPWPEGNLIIFQISSVRSIWRRKVFDQNFLSPRCWARWTPYLWRRPTAARCSSTRLANGEFKIITTVYS